MNLINEIPFFSLFGCISITLLAVMLLYYRVSEEFTKNQKKGLVFLRGTAVFLICFLIFSPQFVFKEKVIEKPILLVGIDNSSSCISGSDSLTVRENLPGILNRLKNALSDKYKVDFYRFGEKVESGNEIDFSDQLSDYGSFADEMEARYYRRNIGAILMIGDGNFNRGKHPLNKLKALQIPTYSLAVGDTIRPSDQVLQTIHANPTAFLQGKFPVKVNFEIFNFNGKKTTIRILQDEKVIENKSIEIPVKDFYFSLEFNIQPEKQGLQEYLVELLPLDGELNLKNNRRKLIINVLNKKRKIIILTGGPHPDIGALRNALSDQGDFDIEVLNANEYKNQITDAHLVILYQLPSSFTGQSDVWKQIGSRRIPYLIVAGQQTDWDQLNLLNFGINLSSITGLSDLSEVAVNEQFGLIEIPAGLTDVVSDWPPVIAPFGDLNLSKGLRVLFNQKIKGVKSTKPLLALGKISNRKVGVLLGEGFWRWRINEYRRFENHQHFDRLFVSIIQYLALRENEDDFIIQHLQHYSSNEKVEFQSEVYDENFNPVRNADVTLKITGEKERMYKYSFDRNDPGYFLNVGILPPGKYHFEGKAIWGEEERIENGEFLVTEIETERLTNKANHRWMYQAAEETGGEVFYCSQIESLNKALLRNERAKQRQYTVENQIEIIHHKFIWFLIIILLATEWFLRKYWGSY